MAEPKPLVIGVNVNENMGREASPHVPWTAEEIAVVAAASQAAGASVMHFHARTPDGGAAHDAASYAATVRAVRSCSDLLLAPAMAVGATAAERFGNIGALQADPQTRIDFLAIDPGTASMDLVDPGTGDFATGDRVFATPVSDQNWFLERAMEHGLTPYLASFNLSWTRAILTHIAAGRVPEPAVVLLVLGGPEFVAAQPASVATIEAQVDALAAAPVEWLVSSHRGDVLEVADHVVARGGHLVVGTGDHPHVERGLPTTPELVKLAAGVGRRHGRQPATPEQARQLLGVRTRADR
ncbi:3-keto-5-aminohexanoate cleavage protein [Nocardioides sp. WG-D5]